MAVFAQAFKIIGNGLGLPAPLSTGAPQAIDATSTTQNYPLGTIATAVDPVLGESEFIYAQGVASTAAGDFVHIYANFQTLREAGANFKGRGGVAMSANVANQFGWYCIKGRCLVGIFENCTALDAYMADATAGTVGVSIVATNHVLGMGLEEGLLAGGSAIVGTTALTPAAKTVAFLTYPTIALAV